MVKSSQYTRPSDGKTVRIGIEEAEQADIDARAKRIVIVDASGNAIGLQRPLPTDGDSVYSKDIWVDESTSENFSGTITDIFDNLHSEMINTTSDNPKTLFIYFNRTIVSNVVGLGSAISGDFSNVKIQIVNSGGVLTTVIDESGSPTKYTSRTFQLPVTVGFNALMITFHTSDTVTLSNCVVLKTIGVVARLQGVKPDNTVVDLNATAGGNFKTSIEEYDESVNPVRKDIEGGGIVSVGTTALEVTFTGTTKHIMITAHPNNTGNLFIGKSNVTNSGANSVAILGAGDIYEDAYDDVDNALYVVSDTANQNFIKGADL